MSGFFRFFGGGRFLGTDKKVDYAENPLWVGGGETRARVYFLPRRDKNAHSSRAKLLARLDATEHARVETPRFRRRLFFSQK